MQVKQDSKPNRPHQQPPNRQPTLLAVGEGCGTGGLMQVRQVKVFTNTETCAIIISG